MVCIFSRGVVRGVAGIYIYLAFWPYGVHIMDIWSSGHTDIWSSEHLVIQSSCHHSRLLAIRTFDHLAIWTSGHPDIWSSAHLVFWPPRLLASCPKNVLIGRFSAYLEGYTNLKFLTSSVLLSNIYLLLWCVWVQNLIESSNMSASCSQLYKILHGKRIKKTRPVSSDEYINLFQCRLCIKYTYIYVQNCLLLSLSTGHVRRMTFFLWGQWAD